MTGTNDYKDSLAGVVLVLLTQTRSHEAVSLCDQCFIQFGGLLGELGKGGLKNVAFLEFFNLVFVNFIRTDGAHDQAGRQHHALVPGHGPVTALQRGGQVAVNKLQRHVVGNGGISSGLEFSTGLNTKLFGDAALISPQGEVGHDESCFSLANNAIQVHVFPLLLFCQGLVACRA